MKILTMIGKVFFLLVALTWAFIKLIYLPIFASIMVYKQIGNELLAVILAGVVFVFVFVLFNYIAKTHMVFKILPRGKPRIIFQFHDIPPPSY